MQIQKSKNKSRKHLKNKKTKKSSSKYNRLFKNIRGGADNSINIDNVYTFRIKGNDTLYRGRITEKYAQANIRDAINRDHIIVTIQFNENNLQNGAEIYNRRFLLARDYYTVGYYDEGLDRYSEIIIESKVN